MIKLLIYCTEKFWELNYQFVFVHFYFTDYTDGANTSGLDKTEAEKQLPWRRLTSRDECPGLSEAPSWANNLAYHGLTDSPYASPQQTIQREGETTLPTVFNIFPRRKSEDSDSAVGVSYEYLNVCPATGEPMTSDEAAASKARMANGVHATFARHRDSGVIDSDENSDTSSKIPKVGESGHPEEVPEHESPSETDKPGNSTKSNETEETKLWRCLSVRIWMLVALLLPRGLSTIYKEVVVTFSALYL